MNREVANLVETAHRLHREALTLLEKDPIQASEKLYKVVENCVKALAIAHNLEEYEIAKMERTWWSKLLARAAHKLSRLLNDDVVLRAWQAAFDIHVYGFHEEIYTQQEVKDAVPIIEKLLDLALRVLRDLE